MRSPTVSRTLPTRSHRRGHSFQFRSPVAIGAPAAAPPPPAIVTIRKRLVPRVSLQPRRVGHAVSVPTVVAIPQFPILLPPARLTLSMPAREAKNIIPVPAAIETAFVRTNLLINSGAETNSDGWNDFNGAVVQQTSSPVHSGAGALVISETLAAQTAAVILSDPIPVRPGERYAASGWVRGEVADKAQLWVNQYDAADAGLVTTSQSVNLTLATWTQIQLQGSSFPMLPTTAYIRVALVFALQSAGNLPTGVPLGQWDDLQLEHGPVATSLIPTDGGIASGHGVAISIPTPPGILSLSAPAPSLSQDLTVVAPAATLTLSAPESSPTFGIPVVPGLLTLSAPIPGILVISAIPPVPAANLVLSMPIPCLKRTLGASIITPGVLALEPLLPADTCA